MRLRHLHLDAYGLFTDHKVDLGEASAHDIVVVCGHNESGKSTMRNGIVEAFYGIENRTTLDFLHNKKDMRIGATIEHEKRSLSFKQFKRKKDPVEDAAGKILAPADLRALMGPMTRPEYERMYSLSQAVLREGGKLMLDPSSTTEQSLFQSAAGLTAFRSVLKALESEAHDIESRAATSVFSRAADKFDLAKRRLNNAKLTKAAWNKVRADFEKAEGLDREARAIEQQAQVQLSRLERITTLAPQVAAYREAACACEEYQGTIDLPEDAISVLTLAKATLAQMDEQLFKQAQEHDQLVEQRDALPMRAAVIDDAPDIRSQHLDSARIAEARRDLPVDRARFDGFKVQAQAAMAALGWTGDIPLQTAQDVQVAIKKLPLAPDLDQIEARIGDFRKVAAALKEAENTCAGLEDACAVAAQSCEQSPAPQPQDALDAAVTQAKLFSNRNSTAIDDLAKEKVALDDQLRKLRWSHGVEELRQAPVPDEAARASVRSALKSTSDQLQMSRTLRQSALDSLESARATYDKLLHSGDPVTADQIAQARLQRDQHWADIRFQPANLERLASVFEQSINNADALSDRRFEHAEQSAALQGAEAACNLAQEKVLAAEAALRTAEERAEQEVRNFQGLLSLAGIPAMEFESLATWITDRDAALTIDTRCKVAQARIKRDEHTASELVRELVAALGPDAPGSAPTLAQALAAGERLQASTLQKAKAAATAEQALTLAKQQLTLAIGKRLTQQKACEQSSLDLATRFERIGVVHDGDVDRAESILTQMSKLKLLFEQMLTLRSERVDPRISLLDAHQKLVERLVSRHLPGRALEEGQQLPALVAHVDHAENVETRRSELEKATSTHTRQLAKLQQDKRAQLDKLGSLYAQAGSEDLDEVLARAKKSNDARSARAGAARLADVLVKSGKGLTLDELLMEDEQVPVDERSARLRAAQQSAQGARATSDNCLKAFQEAEKALKAAGSTDEAAQAEADRVASLALYAHGADRLIAIRSQQELLSRALAIYCESAQGPLLNLASDYFRLLTNGEYERLLIPDPDEPMLVARKRDGRTRDSKWSEGTEDQLYLALRLAAIEQKVDLGHPMPLLADDLFVNFDNQRARAGFEALRKISTKMQVIYFTHHHHLLDIAKVALGNDVRIVDLG